LGSSLNRETWKSFTPEQKKVHLKAAVWMSAKIAIDYFIVANEQAAQAVVKDKGVTINKVGEEFDAIPANYKKEQRETNIATAKKFGVKDPGPIIDYYEAAVERWRAKSKAIGRDVEKFADVLMSEIFSKVDLDKL